MKTILLSKSKYLSGLQCPKLLWVEFNDPKRLPETDATTQFIFDQGHHVGELAKKLFPVGIDIPCENFMDNIKQTNKLLKLRKPLFEAGILIGNLYSRIDILEPSPNTDEWNIVEIKSSTTVKDIHIDDLSFQRFCCEEVGLKIGKCYLVYMNNKYVRNGEIDPSQLFIIADVTAEVENVAVNIHDRIKSMLQVVSLGECPEVIIGPHCRDPYECPLTECWDSLPESNVFTLYYGGKKSFEMYNNGIVTIGEIPDGYKLNDKQRIQQAGVASGEPHVDREAIHGFLSSLEYPLYYLDFETINPAVPLFNGTRPYQHTPFQFSLHVVKDAYSQPEHFSFLTGGTDDPRPSLLSELQKTLGNSGSIIAYNKGFEQGILRDLAPAFPEYSDWIEQVCSRLVDLLLPFRNFDYYHPAQQGSASLKAVLPAITGRGYEDLGISDGQLASISFLSATFGDIPEAERVKVMTDLEQYCERDTEGMIWIVDRLRELCK